MATAATTPAKPVVSTTSAGSAINRVTLPYIIAIAAQLPLLLYYFSNLWARPHYQFFPFAILMVVAFAVIRWPRNLQEPFFRRRLSVVLFWSGIVFGVAGALFAESWFSAASMVMLMASLFGMTRDGEVSGKNLLVLSLPLVIILMLPFNWDFSLITFLQRVSAQISSWYLDILNFKHYSPGTTLNFPDQNYEVERACSGVQSFFTLLFCTSFLIISLRRPWLRATLLLISAGFWAVFMNSIRILVIPIADQVFGIDLKEGLQHELLGYTVMLIAVALILSTDQLLEFLFGRSSNQVDDEGKPGFVRRLFSRKTRATSDQESTTRY
ncbi:MAG: exosortase/archaeosortase family protein, partial [Pirellulaceae bacterium]